MLSENISKQIRFLPDSSGLLIWIWCCLSGRSLLLVRFKGSNIQQAYIRRKVLYSGKITRMEFFPETRFICVPFWQSWVSWNSFVDQVGHKLTGILLSLPPGIKGMCHYAMDGILNVSSSLNRAICIWPSHTPPRTYSRWQFTRRKYYKGTGQ